MIGVNKVTLLGSAGKDPELKNLTGGNVCCRFPLATNSVYFNKNKEKVEEVQWHNIILWGKMATNAKNIIKKGSLLYVEGMIKTRSWEDTEKIKRYATEIHCNVFLILNRQKKEEQAPAGPDPADLEAATPESGFP